MVVSMTPYEAPSKDIDAQRFKEALLLYIQLSEEYSKMIKTMTTYRKQRDSLGEVILLYMKSHNIDECQFENHSVSRRQAKRTATLKKGDIIENLSKLVGESTAVLTVTKMYESREVIYKDALSLKKR